MVDETVSVLEIRTVCDNDCTELIELWTCCGLVMPWNDPLEDFVRKRQTQAELFLVGIVDGRLVASAMAGYDGHRGWLYYLAVDPAFRRRGFGRQLVAAVQSRLQARGCPKLNLQVRSSNRQILDFYERIGFIQDDVLSLGKRLIADE